MSAFTGIVGKPLAVQAVAFKHLKNKKQGRALTKLWDVEDFNSLNRNLDQQSFIDQPCFRFGRYGNML